LMATTVRSRVFEACVPTTTMSSAAEGLGCKGMADNVRVTRDMRRHVQCLEGASRLHTLTCARVWKRGVGLYFRTAFGFYSFSALARRQGATETMRLKGASALLRQGLRQRFATLAHARSALPRRLYVRAAPCPRGAGVSSLTSAFGCQP